MRNHGVYRALVSPVGRRFICGGLHKERDQGMKTEKNPRTPTERLETSEKEDKWKIKQIAKIGE